MVRDPLLRGTLNGAKGPRARYDPCAAPPVSQSAPGRSAARFAAPRSILRMGMIPKRAQRQ